MNIKKENIVSSCWKFQSKEVDGYMTWLDSFETRKKAEEAAKRNAQCGYRIVKCLLIKD